ncbi:MAG: endonuclease/exonuclease/phosphatase family protein [Gemmataceae bacterium]
MALPSRRRLRQFAIAILLILAACIAIFTLNGLVLADRTAPQMKQLAIETAPSASAPNEVTIVAYNIAKAFVHKGGLSFERHESVESRLRRMAEVIRAEKPDFVFLSEAITECGPCDVNQAEFLAREAGLPYVATGENYNVGLPFFRIVGGNAVLSRMPLAPVANFDLAGRQPFYITRNNRRTLVVSAEIGGRTVLLASLHNDSFDMRNNEVQARQILEYLGDRPAIVAGDFNNRPAERSIKLFQESGRFSGAFDGPPTFFEGKRQERLDYILAPAGWELVGHRVIAEDASDHRPLVCRFKHP